MECFQFVTENLILKSMGKKKSPGCYEQHILCSCDHEPHGLEATDHTEMLQLDYSMSACIPNR